MLASASNVKVTGVLELDVILLSIVMTPVMQVGEPGDDVVIVTLAPLLSVVEIEVDLIASSLAVTSDVDEMFLPNLSVMTISTGSNNQSPPRPAFTSPITPSLCPDVST